MINVKMTDKKGNVVEFGGNIDQYKKLVDEGFSISGLCEDGHRYASRKCPICGTVFCWSCCGGTNVHQGGKYETDFMFCPACGHDIYKKNQEVRHDEK